MAGELAEAPVNCTWCRAAGAAPIEVLTVIDGPGVRIQDVRPEDAAPGDVCARCPECGRRKCVRVLTKAA